MAHAVERPGAGSVTITIHEPSSSSAAASAAAPPPAAAATTTAGEVLTLRLAPRRKKKVSWQAGTVDNEFMNKKSSKKCCIFHKNKSFDEDDSDEEDHRDHDHDGHDDHDHESKGKDKGEGKAPCHGSTDGKEGSSQMDCCSHNH